MYMEASQVANDAVGSIRTVASFCAEEKVMDLFKSKCEGPRNAGIKQGLIAGTGYGASVAFLYLFMLPFSMQELIWLRQGKQHSQMFSKFVFLDLCI